MPIYDFDGSTSREIGKLYDWNGSTNSQIKEVYDFDGTTSRLIYKDAPDYLFNWGDNAEITGGWSVKKWVLSGSANGIIGADYLDLYIGNTGNSNRRIYIHTNKAVNVTDLKSISMTYGGTSTVTCPDHNAAWWGIHAPPSTTVKGVRSTAWCLITASILSLGVIVSMDSSSHNCFVLHNILGLLCVSCLYYTIVSIRSIVL
jgi:hypothetical protein